MLTKLEWEKSGLEDAVSITAGFWNLHLWLEGMLEGCLSYRKGQHRHVTKKRYAVV